MTIHRLMARRAAPRSGVGSAEQLQPLKLHLGLDESTLKDVRLAVANIPAHYHEPAVTAQADAVAAPNHLER